MYHKGLTIVNNVSWQLQRIRESAGPVDSPITEATQDQLKGGYNTNWVLYQFPGARHCSMSAILGGVNGLMAEIPEDHIRLHRIGSRLSEVKWIGEARDK